LELIDVNRCEADSLSAVFVSREAGYFAWNRQELFEFMGRTGYSSEIEFIVTGERG